MLVAVIVFSFSLTVCNGDSFIFFHAPAAPSHLMVISLCAFMLCSGIHRGTFTSFRSYAHWQESYPVADTT